jgi:Uma2 family endonuclease
MASSAASHSVGRALSLTRMNDEPAMSAQTETWPRPHRITVHDYYRMAEVGLLHPDDRTELIEGEIIDMPPIGSEHAAVVTLLTRRLISAVDDSVEVRVQLPVRFMPRSEPQPDFALVQHRADVYRHGHPAAKDVVLLIEVSDSTLRFDLEVKARLYAAHRISEYWVIDLVNRRIVRHRGPGRAGYKQRDEIASGAVPLPTLGTEISLAELF